MTLFFNPKRLPVTALATAALLLHSCSKDEEIITDNPDELPSAGAVFKVVEYLPAPGQFINEKATGFNDEKTMAEACEYAQRRLENNLFVSLGAWGGSITVKLDESLSNNGGYEFSVGGNAFDTSSEPGIVWVMRDANNNGLPDDGWYELKGSYFGKEGYERNYWVTYFRPEGKSDVRWEDSHGESGVVEWQGTYHSQDFYYPSWVTTESYILKGSRLPAKTIQNPVSGQWENEAFGWGYADNDGEDSLIEKIDGKSVQKNFFRISDAIDADGNQVYLESIDFIKVQTAVNGKAGVIGENSTEVCGFFLEN